MATTTRKKPTAKKSTAKAKAKPKRVDHTARNKAIVEALKAGSSADDLAKKYGLSKIRVKQIAWQVNTGRTKG